MQNPKTTGTLHTLGTRCYTTHGTTEVPAAGARRVDVARGGVQAVGVGRRVGDRGPIVPVVTRVVQVMVARTDVTGADKEHLSSVPQHECSSIHTHAHSGTILESTYRLPQP